MNQKRQTSLENLKEENRSQLLLVCIIRTVVEKHGGNMESDPITGTFTLSIPECNRAACFNDLEEIIGPGRPLNESYGLVQ